MPTSSVGKTASGPVRPRAPLALFSLRVSAPPRRKSGITLLEMVVVMSIIGLIVGISFPAISAGLDSVRMVSAANSVAAFLNAGVTRAQRRQQAVELIISPKENLLTLFSAEPGFTRELKLPDGILVEAVQPPINDAPDAVRHVIFLPGGAVPGVGIQLANRRDGHRLIKLDPMTGFPRVESVVTR
jgi:prepilin-type N-terminal cleavage/methylation domain-containing protein